MRVLLAHFLETRLEQEKLYKRLQYMNSIPQKLYELLPKPRQWKKLNIYWFIRSVVTTVSVLYAPTFKILRISQQWTQSMLANCTFRCYGSKIFEVILINLSFWYNYLSLRVRGSEWEWEDFIAKKWVKKQSLRSSKIYSDEKYFLAWHSQPLFLQYA